MSRSTRVQGRYKQLNLSLTENELESIKRRAEAVGMRPVHFSRAVLLDQSRKLTASTSPGGKGTSNISLLIYTQLARLGNNLNQLVRHLNRTGDPLPADLEPLLKDIRQIITRVP
jgi:hypothetical protein